MSDSTEVAVAQPTTIAIPSRSERLKSLQNRVKPSSGNIIKVKGEQLLLPDKTKVDTIDCVILDFIARNMYYDPAKPYVEGQFTPPVCAAVGFDVNDNLTPMEESPVMQVDKTDEEGNRVTCADCNMNQFGSKGAGKACQNRRAIAVLPPPGQYRKGEDIAILDLSPTGVAGFDVMISQMASLVGKEPHNFVVTVSVVKAGTSAAKTMGFKSIAQLDEEQVTAFRSGDFI